VAREPNSARRSFISSSMIIGTGLILGGCGGGGSSTTLNDETAKESPGKKDEDQPAEVTASEDLMREHGILRRALLVYTEIVPKLRSIPGVVPPEALLRTAQLFRAFGEDYHESKLEEPYIFPVVKKAGGPAAGLPDILVAQHQRGRQITDYILAATQGAKIGDTNAEGLARTLETFVLMYRNHAAREDTIVFPAWKQTLSAEQYDELGDKFEEIEQQTFGTDGFDDAVRQMNEIEGRLGLTDLAQFTAPAPPSQ